MFQALVPLLTFAILRPRLFKHTDADSQVSQQLIAISSACALVVLKGGSSSLAVIALGLCNASLYAVSLCLLQDVYKDSVQPKHNDTEHGMRGDGLPLQASLSEALQGHGILTLTREVSLAATVMSWLAALSFESFNFEGIQYWPVVGDVLGSHWVYGQHILGTMFALAMTLDHIVLYTSLLATVCALIFPSFLEILVPFRSSACTTVLYYLVTCPASLSPEMRPRFSRASTSLSRLLTTVYFIVRSGNSCEVQVQQTLISVRIRLSG